MISIESKQIYRVLAAGLIGLAMASGANASARYVGYAYDLESGALVYTEEHQEVPMDGAAVRLETAYRDATGETFATREVRFDGGAPDPQPDFELTDTRMNYREGVNEDGDALLVYKVEGEQGRKEKRIEAGRRPLVVDAGFDRFLLREWEKLEAGDFARFDFVNCARLSLIALRLSKLGTRMTEHGEVTDFEMEPNNWLIRLLVDPIVITYRNEDRTLLEYKGLSNVKRPDGGNYVVRIHFPPDERTTATLTASAGGGQ